MTRPWPTVRGIISDLDGVVYRGRHPIPGAAEAIAEWRRKGLPFAFVTNNSTKTPMDVVRQLAGFGAEIDPAQVMTVAAATAAVVARNHAPGAAIYAIGERTLREALEAEGLTLLPDERNAEAVVLGTDEDYGFRHIKAAVRGVMAGAPLYATNPDLLSPCDDGLEPCVGALLAAVVSAVPGPVRPVVVGKPEAAMLHEALALMGTRPEETVMVGDQVSTDILAGKRAGCIGVLVSTGVPPRADDPTVPDFIIDTLGDIPFVGR